MPCASASTTPTDGSQATALRLAFPLVSLDGIFEATFGLALETV